MPPDKSRDFPVQRGDRDDRPAGGGDPVELARDYKAFDLRPLRNQMHVGNAKGQPQYSSLLIGEEAKQMVETTLAHRVSKLGKFLAAANKQEAEAPVAAQPLCRSNHRLKLVPPAEISRIADDEPVSESPFTAQRIVEWRNGLDLLVIAPVRYEADTFRRDAAFTDDLRHAFPDHYVDGGSP